MCRIWNVLFLECALHPKISLGRTPFHYAVSTLFPVWSVLFLECAVFGMCLFWSVLFWECALFGMCSFWNVLFVVNPNICLGRTPFHYAVSTILPCLECALFWMCCFWNVLVLECALFGMCCIRNVPYLTDLVKEL